MSQSETPDRPLGKRQRTFARILDAASRGFRADGFDGAGVDSLAARADVTSGAFYAHMKSKAGAFDHVIRAGMENIEQTITTLQADHGANWLARFLVRYLGQAGGAAEAVCVTAALTGDVARADDQTRRAYAEGMARVEAAFARGLPEGDTPDGRAKAGVAFRLMIGTLSVLRAGGEAFDAATMVDDTAQMIGRLTGLDTRVL